MSGINAFNRAFLFILAVAVAAAGAICVLITTGAIGTGTLALSGWFREQFQNLDALSGDSETIAIVAGAVAIGFGLLLALIEVTPSGTPERRLVSVTDPNGNKVMLPPESIRQIVEQAAMSVSGVVRANATVREANGDGVLIETNALLEPEAHVMQKSNELNDKIRSEMQDRVGVKVTGLHLNLELARGDQADGTHRGLFGMGGDRREKISSSR